MSALDAKIDDLYRLTLTEFTGARNALAKSLTGGDAARVRALAKPTIVPWAVNQVYWRSRAVHDRLMKSGERLRAAQIAALEGHSADVRAASEAQRRAIGDAVAEAERLAAATAGAKPSADALARTFEALSLATGAPQPLGRLTAALQPAGFEALAGIQPREKASGISRRLQPRRSDRSEPLHPIKNAKAAAEEAKKREREAADAKRAAAEQKKHEAAVKDAEAKVTRAEAAERASREIWERAHDELLATRQALMDLRRSRFRSS